MSEAQNQDLVQRIFECFNSGSVAELDDLLAEDMTDNDVASEALGLPPRGRDAARAFVRMAHTAFSDVRFEITHLVAEGDLVAVRSVMTGTHDGDFLGLAPTGRPINVESMDFIRFQGGLAVEHWGVADRATMMQQLGLLPEAVAR